ncbi:ComEA family DNA-binding protein [Nocardioides sp. AX2bis]|uniref:ComEA family DNA-binding protein n=1 Tax=Nocardioides sp. AX2bis TaxID=2653157 RepID=UPI0012F2E904|nr:ComEA family DNA-binding protein [Nocardioides sp. AX2bis]VXB23844.1 ComE operon protein 1 [Nocardioides sp. AX2bis]
MRPPTDSGPGTYDDVLQRRRDALRVRPPDLPGPGDPYVLPVPGRHVSRRAAAEPRAVAGRAVGGVVAGVVPAPLRGRVALGGAQLAVLAVVVAVALSVTAWWVLRADARAVEAPAPAVGLEPAADLVALEPVAATPGTTGMAEPAGPAGPVDASSAAPEGEVTVDVAGRVRRPGVVTLPSGSRVVDALQEAGGARPGVDLSPLNLARVLDDGEQVLVGAPAAGTTTAGAPAPAAPAAPVAPGAPTAAAGTPVGTVDLNTADVVALEALPEVGPVTAAAIVAWREENGGFTAVEELLEVDGIGEVTLAQIAPHATV